MKSYSLYIKSHCAWPDWDYSLDAEDKKVAVNEFYGLLRGEYDKDWIEKHIYEEGTEVSVNEQLAERKKLS